MRVRLQLRSARAARIPFERGTPAVVSEGIGVELMAGAASRARSATDGDVRTTVPVSGRWIAFWLASAAVLADVPTPAGAEVIGAAPGVVGVVAFVGAVGWAKEPTHSNAVMATTGSRNENFIDLLD